MKNRKTIADCVEKWLELEHSDRDPNRENYDFTIAAKSIKRLLVRRLVGNYKNKKTIQGKWLGIYRHALDEAIRIVREA